MRRGFRRRGGRRTTVLRKDSRSISESISYRCTKLPKYLSQSFFEFGIDNHVLVEAKVSMGKLRKGGDVVIGVILPTGRQRGIGIVFVLLSWSRRRRGSRRGRCRRRRGRRGRWRGSLAGVRRRFGFGLLVLRRSMRCEWARSETLLLPVPYKVPQEKTLASNRRPENPGGLYNVSGEDTRTCPATGLPGPLV